MKTHWHCVTIILFWFLQPTLSFIYLQHLQHPHQPSITQMNTCYTKNKNFNYKTVLKADLITNLEWYANEKEKEYNDVNDSIFHIEWLDPSELIQNNNTSLLHMPLYPLNACYMPSQSTQLLNNVEIRNIRMAQNLEKGKYNQLFCVTLRSHDTGRIANVGTIMKAIHFDTQFHPDDPTNIRRIIVTCQPMQRVQIKSIVNPSAFSLQNRIKKEDYFIAQVETFQNENEFDIDSTSTKQWIDELIQNYSMIRYTYKSQDPVAVGSLPPFASKAMQDIPPIKREDLLSQNKFWNCVEIWQNVCYTIREAKRVMIQSDLNEIMIDAAMRKGGPLNLPIHKEDLSVDVQRQLEKMEHTARMEFMDSGLDPCLDFQFLLSCNQQNLRFKLFHTMISRERKRLEAKKKLSSNLFNIDESFQ